MKKTHLISRLLFYGFTFIAVGAPIAAANRMVKVVYFVPRDRPVQRNISTKLDTQIKKVQRFYTEQMEEHGYRGKTFNLENDTSGKLIVYHIIGNFNDAYYHTDTLRKVSEEIDDQHDIEKHIYIVIVDVSTERIQGNCGIAYFDGGPVMVAATGDCTVGEFGITLIAHELGHAFNLVHDFRSDDYIMSYGAGRHRLSKCAASLLNVSPYFNDRHNSRNTPATIHKLTPTTYPANIEDWTLQFDINDADGIYQVQFELAIPGEPASLFDCESVQNRQRTTVEFQMPAGATIDPTNHIWIRVVDVNGNVHTQEWMLTASKTQTPTRTVTTNSTETMLTLSYDAPDALVPTNDKTEWKQKQLPWANRITWEKTPDGRVPRKPNGFMRPDPHIPFMDEWDYWFYAHAVSRIVYDLDGRNYTKFDAYFDMPNPCGSIASVEVIFLADSTEIYKSGVLKGNQARNTHISFDIPKNAQSLTIRVTDGGDGGAYDHFIIANARLVHGEPPPRKVDPKIEGPKLGLSFSTTTTNMRVGDTFMLHLNSEKVTDLAGWQFGIVFDPTVLEALEVSEGNFLKRDGGTTFFRQGRIDNAAGKITGLSSALISEKGVSGTGTLLSVTFSAKAAGETQVTLQDFEFGSINGKVIPVVPYEIVINVGDQPAWDVNQDGRISILDLILVARRLGETASANSDVDVNDDGIISILDLIIITQHMGESTAAAPGLFSFKVFVQFTRRVASWSSLLQRIR